MAQDFDVSLLPFSQNRQNPANIYLFKVNKRNTKEGVKYVKVNNNNTRPTSMT